MKNCTQCGTQLADNANVCSYCGAAQPQQPPQYQPPQYQPPQYQQPPYQNHPYGSYQANIVRTPVKTDYNLLVYIVLSVLTCGIYGMYMIYKMAQDCNQICAEDGDSVGGLGMYILLNIVTCGFYSLYWLYKIQNRLYAAGPRYNVPVAEDGGKVLLWMIVGTLICGIGGLIGFNILFKTLNSVGMAYNARYFYNQPRY